MMGSRDILCCLVSMGGPNRLEGHHDITAVWIISIWNESESA